VTSLITCPSCQTKLRVPEGTGITSYTCPRCLAEIPPGPTTGIATEPTSTPEPVREPRTELSPEPRASLDSCRSCAAPITSRGWRFCPECGARLRGPASAQRLSAADDDFNNDRKKAGWFTILLMVLGAFALFFLGMGAMNDAQYNPEIPIYVLFWLGVVVGIVWLIAYLRTRRKPEELTVARVATSVLWAMGMLVFGWVVLAISVGVFFMIACGRGGRVFH